METMGLMAKEDSQVKLAQVDKLDQVDLRVREEKLDQLVR